MKKASSSLYGEIVYPHNIWGNMMSYSANIKKPNESKSTAVHELGHSLG